MAANSGFPLTLDVKGYLVLVLGGGEEAAEKTQRLLEAGAKVIVVAPSLNDTLKDLAAESTDQMGLAETIQGTKPAERSSEMSG